MSLVWIYRPPLVSLMDNLFKENTGIALLAGHDSHQKEALAFVGKAKHRGQKNWGSVTPKRDVVPFGA